MYKIPEEFKFRLHHVRPRFKNDIENVLVFMATNVTNLGNLNKDIFKSRLNSIIKTYPGNSEKTEKTINNWRTEISSLFGLFYEDNGTTFSGKRAEELTENQDLIQFFKSFLFNFEYPGAHLKDNEIIKMCEAGIHFKPAEYILDVLKKGEEIEGSSVYLTDAEVTHCIFNDLRCTRDNDLPENTWRRIKSLRDRGETYDTKGDVIRYAKDILDYMTIANLLNGQGRRFSINKQEIATVNKFLKLADRFEGYKIFIEHESPINIDKIKKIRVDWFKYVNRNLSDIDFSTDFNIYIPSTIDFEVEKEEIVDILTEHIEYTEKISTAIVGNSGESLVVSHEKQKLKESGQEYLIHLVNFIPTQLGIGYDIQSFECDKSELRKYIEVKTTVSSSAINFNSFHITSNEWRTAKSVKDRYYIYRIQISKFSKKLYIINNLYQLVKDKKLQLVERKDGYDVKFSSNIGYEEGLF